MYGAQNIKVFAEILKLLRLGAFKGMCFYTHELLH